MIVESFMIFLQKIMLFSSYVNNNSSFPKPLTIEEENEYLEKCSCGDKKAKEILINIKLFSYQYSIFVYHSLFHQD